MATASKKMIVLGLGFGFLLLFSLMVMPTDAAGRSISYGTLGSKDVILSCDSKKNHGNCLPPPKNQYERGCRAYHRCRS
ncbi:hypothetical protein LguiA_022782 [Lonicera macranthoides]